MNHQRACEIARTILYEGYLLYPYRSSSLKNSKRCMFGTLYPESWVAGRSGADRSRFQMECLVTGTEATRIAVRIRFLQFVPVESGPEEGVEREIDVEARLEEITGRVREESQSFGGGTQPSVDAGISLTAEQISPGTYKLTLVVRNRGEAETPDYDSAIVHSLGSAHALITVSEGRFASLTDPPPALSEATARCLNDGVWPVLLGEPGEADMMLASPIILSDYPQIAPESPGDWFDATEIDEMLALRVLTLTEDEKAGIRASGPHARDILERAESLPGGHMMRLHGAIRGRSGAAANGLRAGDRVRLRPAKRADIFDTALEGRIAIVAAIEEDFEKNIHVAVVIEDDPGRDLGEMRQIGHRFFFSPSEIEPLEPVADSAGGPE